VKSQLYEMETENYEGKDLTEQDEVDRMKEEADSRSKVMNI